MKVRSYTKEQVSEIKEDRLTNGGYPIAEEIVQFDDLYDMVDFVRTSITDHGFSKYKGYLPSNDTIQARGGTPFNQAPDVLTTIGLAENGWAEGRHRLSEFEAALEQQWNNQVDSNMFVQDLHGFEVDVPTFLTGAPEHMVAFEKRQSKARAVKVVVDLNVRCDACGRRQHDAQPTDPNWVLLRGAAITMLVKLLVRANYTPKLIGRITSLYHDVSQYNSKEWWPANTKREFLRTIEFPIHDYGDTFDIDRINFCVSHESLVRRLEWRVHEILNYRLDGKMPTKGTDVVSFGRGSRQPVGRVMLGSSHTATFMSLLPLGDIHIPSLPQMYDMSNFVAREELDVAKIGTISNATELLVKVGADHIEDAFDSPENAAVWVFNTLASQGVSLS